MQQLVALQGNLIVFVDERSGTSIVQTYIGWDRLVSVARLVHVLGQFIEQGNLCVRLVQFLCIGVSVAEGCRGIHAQLYHIVALFVVLQLSFGVTQLCVDLLQTLVDELFCAYCNLVLVLVGLSVIDDGELLQIVDGTLWNLVSDDELRNRCRLSRRAYAEASHILASGNLWRNHGHLQALAISQHIVAILRELDHTHTCAKSGWQCGDNLVNSDRTRVVRVVVDRYEVRAYHVIVSAFSCNLEAHRSIELLQVLIVHIYIDFLLTIDQVVLDSTLMAVGGVELEVIDSLLSQSSRLQNLHLVVDTIAVGNDT